MMSLGSMDYGHGERNERGQKLLDFRAERQLVIINTFFDCTTGTCTLGEVQMERPGHRLLTF